MCLIATCRCTLFPGFLCSVGLCVSFSWFKLLLFKRISVCVFQCADEHHFVPVRELLTHTHTQTLTHRHSHRQVCFVVHCSLLSENTTTGGITIRFIRFHRLLSGLGIKRLQMTWMHNLISRFIITFTNPTLYSYCCIVQGVQEVTSESLWLQTLLRQYNK